MGKFDMVFVVKKFSVYIRIILFLALTGNGACELPVVVSRGAFIKPIKGVTIYNDLHVLHHMISDLPDPPKSITRPCPEGATPRSCELSNHLHKIMEDNANVLTILNLARTSYGLVNSPLPDTKIDKTSFRPVEEHKVHSDPPGEDIIQFVGRNWYEEVQNRLLSRQPYYTSANVTHHVSKRWLQYIKPVVLGAAALMGVDDLVDFMADLFVGENGIAKFLATLAATTPEQSFVDLSRRVSEFEARTRQITSNLAQEAEQVQRLTEELQQDVARHMVDLATTEDTVLVTQQLLSDLGTMVFTYGIYFSYMVSDTLCRSGFLSPIVLPPHMLAEKLIEVAAALPKDQKLAIPLEEIQTYYTTKSASCIYDSFGGLTTISVPVVFKSVDYTLFEYRNIYFAWDGTLTCTVNADSKYVIKDVKSNEAFAVDEIDIERCSPHLDRRCRVPPHSDNSNSMCISQLLSSSTVAQLRESCKMTCFNRKETLVSQFAPNIFMAVHVPKNTLSIECPNHATYNITEEVKYGTLRIILKCVCTLTLNGKTVGRSVGPVCEGHESTTVDILLPGHWTTLSDIIPFTNDGELDSTTFIHKEEIFNEHALDAEEEEDTSILTTEVSIVAVLWNFVHSLILAYLMFRLNVLNGAGGAVTLSAIRGVEGAPAHFCRLEDNVYYYLYTIIALCSLAFIPAIIFKFYSFITSQFWFAVDRMTDKRIADGTF